MHRVSTVRGTLLRVLPPVKVLVIGGSYSPRSQTIPSQIEIAIAGE